MRKSWFLYFSRNRVQEFRKSCKGRSIRYLQSELLKKGEVQMSSGEFRFCVFRKVVRKLRKHPTKQKRSFADSNQLLYNRVEDDQLNDFTNSVDEMQKGGRM